MPELPEVEAVCRRLRRDAVHSEIVTAKILHPSVTRPQLTHTIEKRAAGRTIEALRRRRKNILIDLSGDEVLHIHLRMSGNLLVTPTPDLASDVYGREGEPCRRCGKIIRRIPQGGRSTYFCPFCQR